MKLPGETEKVGGPRIDLRFEPVAVYESIAFAFQIPQALMLGMKAFDEEYRLIRRDCSLSAP